MNRMEDIKIKLKDSEFVAVDFTVEEVQYLLSKLDIAEQFIKAVEIVSRIKEYEDLNKMSIDAIQLIRE